MILAWIKAGAVVAVILGAFWLVDEIGDRREAIVNARWEKRLADARAVERLKSLARERTAAKLGDGERASLTRLLQEADVARQEAEAKLADRGKAIAYPKDIIKAMNK